MSLIRSEIGYLTAMKNHGIDPNQGEQVMGFNVDGIKRMAANWQDWDELGKLPGSKLSKDQATIVGYAADFAQKNYVETTTREAADLEREFMGILAGESFMGRVGGNPSKLDKLVAAYMVTGGRPTPKRLDSINRGR